MILSRIGIKSIINRGKVMVVEESFRSNIKVSKRICIIVNRCILMVRIYKVNGRIVIDIS